MTPPPEQLETEKLLLRRPRRSDAKDILNRYAGDSDVTKYLSWPRHESLDDTHAFLELSNDEWERWHVGPYLILDKENEERVLGSTGLSVLDTSTTTTSHQDDEMLSAETGYVLAKDAWGKGYASEALRAMVEIAREWEDMVQLKAECHADNAASIRVLERGGFDRTGVAKREFPNLKGHADVVVYSLDVR